MCVPVPFYHCFGMVIGNLGSTSRGACVVVPAESFDPLSVLEQPDLGPVQRGPNRELLLREPGEATAAQEVLAESSRDLFRSHLAVLLRHERRVRG